MRVASNLFRRNPLALLLFLRSLSPGVAACEAFRDRLKSSLTGAKYRKESNMLRTNFMNPSCAVIAFGSVAIATVLRALINVLLNEQVPYSTFYPAVMLTALCCGLSWGLASTMLSALAASFWLTPMGRPLITEPNDLTGMGLFLLVCVLIVWLAARVRAHRKEAEQAAEEREELFIREQFARKEAESANRAKDDFLAAVSHELRTPLHSILGWVQLLRQHEMSADETELAMESIERSARIQTQLISDLMDLSRMRMGKLRIEVQPVCLSEIVHSAIQTVLPAAKAKGITIDAPERPSVGPVLADPNRVHQIVWNLLSNAIKFTPSGGTIRALVTDNGDHAELMVIDSGQGIEASFLPLVFDRFQQATTKRNQGGLGLGLSIVKELIELHGGRIEASSSGIGRGSVFRVTLPKLKVPAVAEERVSKAPSSPSNTRHVLSGKRILIVDDDLEARSLIESVLRQEGAETMSAASAAEANELLETEVPDVLISDLGMPDTDGFEFIRTVSSRRATPKPIPAVALTAYTSDIDRSRAIESGFQVHLGKPVEASELINSVAGLTEGRDPS
jgi:signal transduction histidine kinase/ActR/RegA family two-component response regulator